MSDEEPDRDNFIPMEVVTQGAVKVSHAYLWARSEEIACIYVDLESKRAELFTTNHGDEDTGPCMYFEAGELTAFLDESRDRKEMTIISFPDFKGWRVFSSGGPGRYTAHIVLTAPSVAKRHWGEAAG